jgi:hypothetical protein
MNEGLEAVKKAVDELDFDKARKLADAYVKANPDEFADYTDMTLESVVQAVDVFRAAGMLDNQYRAEVWHLHAWEPQAIGGNVVPQKRSN